MKYGKVNGKGPFKEVNLKGARVVTDRKSRRKFTIITYNKQKVQVKTDNEDDRDKWVNAIETIIINTGLSLRQQSIQLINSSNK